MPALKREIQGMREAQYSGSSGTLFLESAIQSWLGLHEEPQLSAPCVDIHKQKPVCFGCVMDTRDRLGKWLCLAEWQETEWEWIKWLEWIKEKFTNSKFTKTVSRVESRRQCLLVNRHLGQLGCPNSILNGHFWFSGSLSLHCIYLCIFSIFSLFQFYSFSMLWKSSLFICHFSKIVLPTFRSDNQPNILIPENPAEAPSLWSIYPDYL